MLTSAEAEGLTDAMLASVLAECRDDVDAAVQVLRRASQIVHAENKTTVKVVAPKTSPKKKTASKCAVVKAHRAYVSRYTSSAVGADQRLHHGADPALHHGANRALHRGPQLS